MGNNQSQQQQQQQQLYYAQQMLQSYRYQQQQQLSQQLAQQTQAKPVHLPVNEPSLVLEPFLYLGGSYGNRNAPLLYYLGITHVLNMAIELPMNPDLYNNRFKLKHIAAHDTDRYNIRKDFETAFQFIDDARSMGSKVLVHCMMGISRSATIVIAYLMNRFGMSLPQAYSYVKGKRQEIGPNRHFMRTLVQYEQELRYPKSAMQSTRNTTPIQRNYTVNNNNNNNNTSNGINSTYNSVNSNNMVNSVHSTAPATRNKRRHHNKTNQQQTAKQQQRPMSALVSDSRLNYQREMERNQRNHTPFYPNEIIAGAPNIITQIDVSSSNNNSTNTPSNALVVNNNSSNTNKRN